MKQFLWHSAGAGIDQRADVRIPCRDHTGERRIDFLEGLQLLQPVNIGRHGINRGLASTEIADRLIGLLLGNRVRLKQVLPPRRGNLCQLLVCLGILQVCACLFQLLINLRGVDVCQQLPLLHMGPDIYIPMLEVSTGAGINRRVVERLRVARQHDLLRQTSRARLNHIDCWNCCPLRTGAEGALRLRTFMNAGVDDKPEHKDYRCQTKQQPWGRRLRRWWLHPLHIGFGKVGWRVLNAAHVKSPFVLVQLRVNRCVLSIRNRLSVRRRTPSVQHGKD